MLTFFVLTLLGFILLLFEDRYKIKRINIKYSFLIFEAILLMFSVNNPDYRVYEISYVNNDASYYYESGIHVISDILKKIGLVNYKTFLFLVFLLILITFKVWGEKIRHINWVIFLYSLFIMYYDCIQIRNTIAMFLILLALYLSIVDKKIFAIVLCVTAIFFHRLAILTGLIVLYTMIVKYNKNHKISKKEILFITIAGLSISVLGMPIIRLITSRIPSLEKINLYLSSNLSIDSFIIWAGPVIMYSFLMWKFAVKRILSADNSDVSLKKKKFVSVLFRYSLFGIAASGFLLYINEFNRLYRMFYLIFYLLFGLIEAEIPKKERYMLFALMASINVIFMNIVIYRGVNFDLYW